jgi:multiple sugar transport system permease protein
MTMLKVRARQERAEPSVATGPPPMPNTSRAKRWTLHIAVGLGALLFFMPFYWMVATALKPQSEVLAIPPTWFPSTLVWENFSSALSEFPFLNGLKNTAIIVLLTEVGRLVSVPLAAYAFARLEFRGKNVLFILVLATMMLPYYVTLVPQYLIFRDLGWLNSILPLVVPSFFGLGGAFFIFMLRQFYLSIPKEYDDAAMLDGCGRLRIFWYIILPLSKPALAAMAIFTFMETWNDFIAPLIYLDQPSKYTLALYFQAWANVPTGVEPQPFSQIMAAATVICLVPTAVFFIGQRYFLRGLVVSGVQG